MDRSCIDFTLMPPFSGDGSQDAKLWLTRFQLLTTTKGLNDNKAKATLPLLLTDNALRWYMSLAQNIKDDLNLLQKEFIIRYGPDERVQWQRTSALYQTLQSSNEKVEDFIANIVAKGTELELPQTQIKHIIINGLKPDIRQFVLQKNPETVDDLRQSILACSRHRGKHVYKVKWRDFLKTTWEPEEALPMFAPDISCHRNTKRKKKKKFSK